MFARNLTVGLIKTIENINIIEESDSNLKFSIKGVDDRFFNLFFWETKIENPYCPVAQLDIYTNDEDYILPTLNFYKNDILTRFLAFVWAIDALSKTE